MKIYIDSDGNFIMHIQMNLLLSFKKSRDTTSRTFNQIDESG